MEKKAFLNGFHLYWIFAVIGVLAASCYPLYMGVRVVTDMIRDGSVRAENYPKYIIPYTPISLAVIVSVLLMPLAFKLAKRFALLAASGLSLGVFFLSELLLESKVIVTDTVQTTLESWQMYMCYVHPEGYETRTWKAIDVLIGDYSPAFKLHFYFIAIVLILAILSCLYGFGKMVQSGDRSRLRHLIVQSVCTGMFLAMCIWACFTAFYRTGELTVSPVSAILMSVFFMLFGVTGGIYAGLFLNGKKQWMSAVLPAVTASCVTLLMYIAEMMLLSRHLYRFGQGFLFSGIPGIVLAPVDLLIILAAGMLTFFLNKRISAKQKSTM